MEIVTNDKRCLKHQKVYIILFKRKEKELESSLTPKRMGELLLTRFTHDIAGPISAIANGLDFIMEASQGGKEDHGGVEIKNQAIDLVEDSSKQALARLQAYRVAYGVVYNDSVMTETDEIRDILKRFFHKSQIEVRWNSSTPKKLTAAARRLCISMILTMSRVLIYGGKISVSFVDESKTIVVKAQSQKFKEPNTIKEILMNTAQVEPDVENIPYFFIKDVCRSSGIKVYFDYNNDEVKTAEFKVEFTS